MHFLNVSRLYCCKRREDIDILLNEETSTNGDVQPMAINIAGGGSW